MASSSSAVAARVLCVLALAATTGCFTGRVFEAGRIRESVVAYRSASLDGASLWLDYRVERRSRLATSGARRTARVPLAALAAQPAHPVDAFPLSILRGGERPPGATPVEVRVGGSAAPTDGPALLVRAEDGRHAGFRLCGAVPGCAGPFHSDALYRDRLAWWVYPLVPLGVALDVGLFPIQLVTVSPFFLAGD